MQAKGFRWQLIASLLPLTLALSANAHANNIVVNSLGDPSVTGKCTLHDAIVAANTDVKVNGCAAGSGNDAITFKVGGTIVLSATLPEIEKTLTITGPAQGIAVSGNNAVVVMVTDTTSTVYLSNLTIEDGFLGGFGAVGPFGAGILNQGNLNVSYGHFIGNNIVGSQAGGAAIANLGPLNVKSSSFFNNSVTGSGLAQGGAIISISPNAINVSDCTFSKNSAVATGGGLSIGGAIGQGSPAVITVKNSAFTSNSASTDSGLAFGGLSDSAGRT